MHPDIFLCKYKLILCIRLWNEILSLKSLLTSNPPKFSVLLRSWCKVKNSIYFYIFTKICSRQHHRLFSYVYDILHQIFTIFAWKNPRIHFQFFFLNISTNRFCSLVPFSPQFLIIYQNFIKPEKIIFLIRFNRAENFYQKLFSEV